MNLYKISLTAAVLAVITLAPSLAEAVYNANHSSTVLWYRVYRGGNICAGPTMPPPGCPVGIYFCASAAGTTESGLSRMLATLIAAKAKNVAVNWGYDSNACVPGSLIEAIGE